METLGAFVISGLPRIVFGDGTFRSLPDLIRSYGRQALIITGGNSLKQSGRQDALALSLEQSAVIWHFAPIQGEPTTGWIDAIVADYRTTPVNVVAAIGGGSVMDCGKAVSAMLTEEGCVKDYLEDVGYKKPSGSKIPFIAVPTTAGTGSEATKNAVVCDRQTGFKKSLRHDAYMPDVALIDPEMTKTAPRSVTVACGLDAVAQLIESYTSVKANLFTNSLALKAMAFAFESLLPLSLDQSQNMTLRRKMSYAALISGISLSQAGLGAVHGLAGPLGGLIPVPHGVACGKLLFPVMTFVVKKVLNENNLAARKRFADIGKLMSGDFTGDDTMGCKRFLNGLHRWTQALQLPQLSRFGMNSVHIEKTLDLADVKNSPARLSREEMKVILETVR